MITSDGDQSGLAARIAARGRGQARDECRAASAAALAKAGITRAAPGTTTSQAWGPLVAGRAGSGTDRTAGLGRSGTRMGHAMADRLAWPDAPLAGSRHEF